MRRTLLAVIVILLVTTNAQSGTLKKVLLGKGRKDDNTLRSPVIVASAPLEIGTFVQGFPDGQLLHRKKSGGVMGGKTKASPDLDFGPILAEALRTEARPMGFELGAGGGSWRGP